MKLGKIGKRIVAAACVAMMLAAPLQTGNTTASAKVGTLVLDKTTCVMKKGTKRKLKATASLNDLDGSVKWTSSNWKVATVSQKGMVEAKKNGKAVIRVTAGGQKASCKVIVGTPVSKIKTSKKTVSLTEGTTVRLKTNVVPKKASIGTLSYVSKNKKVATVSKKGLVRGIAKGTTRITVRSKDGNNKKATIKVNVQPDPDKNTQPPVNVTVNPVINVICPTPVPGSNPGNSGNAGNTGSTGDVGNNGNTTDIKATGISLSDMEKSLDINETVQLTASVAPADASDKSVTWESSDKAVATVSERGLVTPEGEGTAEISAATADGKHSAVCTVTVTPTAVVSTNKEITYALSKKNLKTLEVRGDTAKKLTVPAGTYGNVDMVVDLPNGELENNGVFKSIVIEDIAEDTYFENAIGNIIKVISRKAHIIVNEKASTSVIVSKDSKQTSIENNGTITKLEVNTTGKVNITGKSKEKISVQIKAEVTISTTQKLDIDASSRFDVTIRPGAESSAIQVDVEANVPNIFGLGVITVKITATSETKTIVSENNGTDELAQNVRFTGTVRDIDGNAVDGASIYIVPYKNEDNYDIQDIWTDDNAVRLTTNSDGEYSTKSKIKTGHYYLAARKEGYLDMPQQAVLIESTYGDTYTNQEIVLLPADWKGKTGNVTGKVLDSAVKDLALPDIAVRIRKGSNAKDSSIAVVKETRTDKEGNYLFEGLDVGEYTIELEDYKNVSSDKEGYATTWINVLIRPDVTVTEGAIMSTKTLTEKQIRFILSWGARDSGAVPDLDAHLRGPGGYDWDSDYRFHTFYSRKLFDNGNSERRSCADLDVDDVDYEGPETTTIYQSIPGIYSYYIHDFTNRNSRSSSKLSESSVKVEVYIGNEKQNTYYIPQKEGTVWHVFDYDSNSGVVKTVNTMYYENNPENVGNTVEQYKKDIILHLTSIEGYREVLDSETSKDITEKVAVYRKQMDTLVDQQEAEAARLADEVRQYENDLHNKCNECNLGCSAERVYSSSYEGSHGNKLVLWVDRQDYEPTVDSFSGRGNASVEEVDCADSEAWKAFRVTVNGYSKVTYVYLNFDPERIEITLAKEGEQSLDWQVGQDYTDGIEQYPCIYLYSRQQETEVDIKDVEFTFSPDMVNVTYDSGKVEGEYTVTAKSDFKTKTWVVRKMPVPQIADSDNKIYKTRINGNYLYVYADNKVLDEDCMFKVNGRQCELSKVILDSNYSYYRAYAWEEGINYYIYCYAMDDACSLTRVNFDQNVEASISQTDASVTVTGKDSSVEAADLSLAGSSTAQSDTEVQYEAVTGEDYVGKITVTMKDVADYSKVYKVYFTPYQQP